MQTSEKLLYHQIHPAKLAVDIGSSLISTWLFWEHWPFWALLVTFPPSIVISAAMVRWMDFSSQRDSAMGRYLAFHMTRRAEGVRFAGQVVAWIAAWFHAGWAIGLGWAVIVFGWVYSVPAWRRRS